MYVFSRKNDIFAYYNTPVPAMPGLRVNIYVKDLHIHERN